MSLRVYLSGPMTGYENYNFGEFNRWTECLQERGYAVVNPADNDMGHADKPREFYLRTDILALMCCDAIALMPGWEKSKGARLEFHIAQELSITDFTVSHLCSIDVDAAEEIIRPTTRLVDAVVETYPGFGPDPAEFPVEKADQGGTKDDNDNDNRGGTKYDDDRPRLDLISPKAIHALGVVLAGGAKKYKPRNWEEGIRFGRVYRAAMTHMNDWWDNREKDKDSRLHPLWHALCNLMFLVHYTSHEEKYQKFDDRPK